jgi:spermidine/putrescine transport system substrate-binding protein
VNLPRSDRRRESLDTARTSAYATSRRDFLIAGTSVLGSCAGNAPRLNIYNWSDYVAPDTIPNFVKEFGIRVRYGTFESIPEMLAKVMSGNSGWDIVFPSAEYIQPMRDMGLLARLNHAWLPDLDALEATFLHPPWDPQLDWCVPYMHGVTGIAYRRDLQPAPLSWSSMWEDRLRGKVTMLDDPPEVFGACLKMLGYSLNSGNPEELRKAQKKAIEQKRVLRAYLNAEVRDQLASGDVAAAQAWAVTAAQAMTGAPGKVAFSFPTEGFARFADNVAILRESRRSKSAHAFINYLLRPRVAADIVNSVKTATANARAHALLGPELRDHPALYPSEEILSRGEWFAPQPAEVQRLRDRLWTEIKSA